MSEKIVLRTNKYGNHVAISFEDIRKALDIIDTLRSVMYSENDGNNNFYEEIEMLSRKLSRFDNVDHEMNESHNRLVQMCKVLQSFPLVFQAIENLNNQSIK